MEVKRIEPGNNGAVADESTHLSPAEQEVLASAAAFTHVYDKLVYK